MEYINRSEERRRPSLYLHMLQSEHLDTVVQSQLSLSAFGQLRCKPFTLLIVQLNGIQGVLPVWGGWYCVLDTV